MGRESVSITVGTDEASLLRGADLLRRMAGGTVEVESTVSIVGPPKDLSPEDEAEATDQRIDAMVAAATPLAGLDLDGRPWDERIDSGAKSKTADGRWKLRRGVEATLVESVKAELFAVAPVALPVAPVEVAPVALPVAPVEVAPVALPVEAPVAGSVTTYPELIKLITDRGNLLGSGDVKGAIAASGAHGAGLMELLDLAPAQHLCWIPLVAAELRKIWATTRV